MNIVEFEKEWKQKWFQYILDHPEKDWNYAHLSRNPNVTWEMVQQNPQIKWDYQQLSINPNITW